MPEIAVDDEPKAVPMTRRDVAAVTVAVALSLAPSGGRLAAQGGLIESLAVGLWLELPNTKIRSVLPNPLPPGDPSSLVVAWGGGATDTERSRLIVWGGGHNDYYGNEIYVLDLAVRTIRRLTNPSPIGSTRRCLPTLPDGTPASRHTYGNLAYMAHVDRLFAFGGYIACPSGAGFRDTWTFSFATNQWQAMSPSGDVPTGVILASAYDPVTRRVFLHDTVGFYSYAFETDSYTRHIADAPTDYHLTAGIDPGRRKFILLGDGVQVIDLNTFAFSTLATTNTPALATTRQYPGLAYDPVADRMVAWHGGNEVHALNLGTGAWTQVATNMGPNVPAPYQGTNGRWGYFPRYGVFAVINSIDQNAFVFRLAPAPGQTMLAAPTGLRVVR